MHKLKDALYRWLPRIFFCHQMPERSFSWRGEPLPLCARCTGVLLGLIAAPAIALVWRAPILLCLAALLPLIADGTVQTATRYESTNLRRLITGLLFGVALATLLIHSAIFAYQYGYHIGKA